MVVKFSIHLNWRVFVMKTSKPATDYPYLHICGNSRFQSYKVVSDKLSVESQL